ncbi:MAG: glycosyltransferase family 2 protein, partial [Microbacteriaceae bacterium]
AGERPAVARPAAGPAPGTRVAVWTMVLAMTSIAVAAPMAIEIGTGASALQPSDGKRLPAYVTAEAAEKPWLGTLVLAAQSDGSLTATLERGVGTALDDENTVWSTTTSLDDDRAELATIAANAVSRSGFDLGSALAAHDIAFVVLSGSASDLGVVTRDAAIDALDADSALTAVGDTSTGLLWYAADVADESSPTLAAVGGGPFRLPVLIADGVVFGITLLLAVPTGRRRSRVAPAAHELTLTEDEDD